MTASVEVKVGNRRVRLSNLDKVFYPDTGFTKAQVVDYYHRVAPALLPHLKGRPLTLKRYPDGVTAAYFYEKNCPSHRPEWMATVRVWSGRKDDYTNYCVVNNLPSLIWAANMASLELHTSLALAKDVLRPTMMIFDLDPGAPAAIRECCEVAVRLRRLLARLHLDCYPKTSGSKGVQVYVPLNARVTYEDTKPLAHAVAQQLEQEDRTLVVSNMSKSLRGGKVFVDWSQNDQHKTTVCVYSLRARESPTASTPVTWKEVADMARGKRDSLAFTADEVLARVEKHGDLFEPVATQRQKLPRLA